MLSTGALRNPFFAAAALCCLGRPAALGDGDGGGVPSGTKANEVIVCITGGHHLHGQVLL